MKAEPTREHEWLMQMVGEWTVELSCTMPDGSASTSEGREVVRAIGDIWIIGEGDAPTPEGEPMISVITLGFDPAKKKFVGSWVGSPMAQLVVYEGERGGTGDVLTLDCEAPGFEDPTKLATYQDIIEIRSPDERAMISQVKNTDGSWTRFMEAVYRRVK